MHSCDVDLGILQVLLLGAMRGSRRCVQGGAALLHGSIEGEQPWYLGLGKKRNVQILSDKQGLALK